MRFRLESGDHYVEFDEPTREAAILAMGMLWDTIRPQDTWMKIGAAKLAYEMRATDKRRPQNRPPA
jgi:hypothetical protein